MTLTHADTSLAARHARLNTDLLAMRQKYPLPEVPKVISKRSRKLPKVDDSAKIRRSNITAVVVVLLILYLIGSGIYVNIRWLVY